MRINPDKLYKNGIKAYNKNNYEKANKLFNEAINNGLQEPLLSDARSRLQMSVKSDNAIIDHITGMAFVLVKGGCFQMGDTFGDGAASEKPVHEVCVSDFYMGKYEVTQGQWKKLMGNNPSDLNDCADDDCPVKQVSWDDAQAFISKLNTKSGKNYRLPMEAEWEYAARSGGKREKWAGTSNESSLGNYAWYDDNSEGRAHPVGKKRANGLGFYDMSGNVLEWCEDWYGKSYYSESPRNNPRGPSAGQARVLRGGPWAVRWWVRTSVRDAKLPYLAGHATGFRVAAPAR